ncbi:hypothetical protein GCM10023193_55880 [Planotetraspora kaengkrachanensis]|uniref:Uncharacterized protein n=1 Tax=Planotetraspora kaengkrachanensis TaxID=575193 RepID=A0A8J3PUJ8_9ACTN|nr:hypothetical protein Pka01_44730 [Planotetraspora kaengkrachanensis]
MSDVDNNRTVGTEVDGVVPDGTEFDGVEFDGVEFDGVELVGIELELDGSGRTEVPPSGSSPRSWVSRRQESPGSQIDAHPGLPVRSRTVARDGGRSLVTVAGPRRLRTGFLPVPSSPMRLRQPDGMQ